MWGRPRPRAKKCVWWLMATLPTLSAAARSDKKWDYKIPRELRCRDMHCHGASLGVLAAAANYNSPCLKAQVSRLPRRLTRDEWLHEVSSSRTPQNLNRKHHNQYCREGHQEFSIRRIEWEQWPDNQPEGLANRIEWPEKSNERHREVANHQIPGNVLVINLDRIKNETRPTQL